MVAAGVVGPADRHAVPCCPISSSGSESPGVVRRPQSCLGGCAAAAVVSPVDARTEKNALRWMDVEAADDGWCMSGAVARHLVADLTEPYDRLSAVDDRHRAALGHRSSSGSGRPRSRRARRLTSAARHGSRLGRLRHAVITRL